MQKNKLAIVTMLYNEPDILPIWLKYYTTQVPLEQLYIIDHGSTDNCTYGLGSANIIRVPRTPLDEAQRCKFISEICNSLLNWYEFVAYTDVDEFLVADPQYHRGLVDLCTNSQHDVTTALGVHLVHYVPTEPELVPMAPILRQRKWVLGVGSMSKPTLTRRPINWAPGFHYADDQTYFSDLFLFHLAYCDIPMVRRRQTKRQSVEITDDHSTHHRAGDEFVRHLESWCTMPLIENAELDRDCPVRSAFVAQLFATRGGGNGPQQIDATVSGAGLWALPDRLRGVF